jgi:glycosyltransferase involved in cell wall biosynthesis
MKALFLTKYSRRGASSRYRALQYFPYLKDRRWTISWQPFLTDAYLDLFYESGRRSWWEGFAAIGRRNRYAFAGLSSFDVIYVENEIFPRVPSWLERLLFPTSATVVVDYDDAVFMPYRNSPLLKNKIASVIGSAAEVIVGNEFLRSYAASYNSRVNVIPTVIDLSKYRPKEDYSLNDPNGVVIGWIGTPSTARHLAAFASVLRKLSAKHAILVRCVGTSADFRLPGICVQNLPWSEESEAEIIRTFDIGIMPLLDESFVLGKCGLKLIQYMGCGVPAIGQAVGANAEIITDGCDGYLAASGDQYLDKLERLIAGRDLRRSLGRAGRRTVEERYSLQVQASRFCDVLTRAAGTRARPECALAGC